MGLDPIILEETRRAYRQAIGRSAKKQVVLDGMQRCGFRSYGGFVRHLNLGELCLTNRATRKRSQKENERVEQKKSLAVLIWNQAMQYTFGDTKMKVSAAHRYLLREGRIPTNISLKSLYAYIKPLKNESRSLAKRFERSNPLELVQMDFSRSRYVEYISDKKTNEWSLRIRNPDYTRKEDLRLWFGCSVDDATRVGFAKYYITKGEDTNVAEDLIEDTFSEKESCDLTTGETTGVRKLLQGIPRTIYVDQGPGFKSSTKIGLEKAGVEMILGTKEKDTKGRELNDPNKKARGKVERMNGNIKEMFESSLIQELGIGTMLGLDDLNDRLHRWLEEFNSLRHPTHKTDFKWDLFEKTFETIRYPSEDFRTRFVRPIIRRVINGLLKVTPKVWCKAPSWANEGDEIEIVLSNRQYYTLHKGKRLLLEVFTSLDDAIKPTKREEQASDALEGRPLKKRLADEIENASRGEMTLGSLPDDFEDDIRFFCESPRTITEIREQAVRFVMQCEARDKEEAKPRIAFIQGAPV
jgi:hypothetical protein